MKKHKLLYFVSEDEYFLTHKIKQAHSALKNNLDVLVVCKFSSYEKKIKSMGFKTRHLNLDRRSINPFKEFFCLIKFYEIVKNFEPDFIQSVALKPILYTSLISKLVGKTKILLCVVGLGFLFINKNLSTKIIKFCYVFLLKIFLIKNKALFIFQNYDDKLDFEKKKITKYSKSEIIRGSGVDTLKFKKINTKKIYDVIFHSRILYDKGFLELIKAIKILKKNKPIKVLVLGIPDQGNKSAVEYKKLINWQKEKLIIWYGKKKNVVPYIQKSRLAVLPSYREGLPKSMLEASSCELPVITSNVEGCKEVCIDGFNGILIPVKDHVTLSKAIKKILENKKLEILYGKNGRKMIQRNFSDKVINKQFMNIYKALI